MGASVPDPNWGGDSERWRSLKSMSGWSLVEQVAERLRTIGDLPGGGRIGGFWIRPDPYLDREEAVVLVLDLLEEVSGADLVAPSTRAAVAKSVDVSERVAEVLGDIIPNLMPVRVE